MEIVKNVEKIINSSDINGDIYGFIFDIDDTIITYNKTTKLWSRIETLYKLYKLAVTKKFKIFFVTARIYTPQNFKETLKQLINFGFNTFDGLYMLPHKKTNICKFKSNIRKLITQDLIIILNIGNEWHDVLSYTPFNLLKKKKNDGNTYIFNGILEPIILCVKLPEKPKKNGFI